MGKLMQKLVFFIEPTGMDGYGPYGQAPTVGNLYMNKFAIDEDAGHEIVNIYKVEKHHRSYHTLEEKEQKGKDQIILTLST